MNARRLIFCLMLSVMLIVTFIPTMAFGSVEYSGEPQWTVSEHNGDEELYLDASEEPVRLAVDADFSAYDEGEVPELKYQWFCYDSESEDWAILHDATGSEYSAYTGTYYCEVADDEGKSARVTFYVYPYSEYEDDDDDVMWRIWSDEEGTVYITKTKTEAKLTIEADIEKCDADPVLSYQWYREDYNSDTGEEEWVLVSGATGTEYIAKATGEYRCEVTDKEGNSKRLYFRVEYRTDWAVESDWSDAYLTKSKKSATLKVDVDTSACSQEPKLSYQWLREAEEYNEETGGYYSVINGATGKTYAATQPGDYYCEVFDGEYTNSAWFTVKYEPEWDATAHESEVPITKSKKSATLKVDVDTSACSDVPSLKYQWYDANDEPIAGATGETYTVTKTPQNGEDYYCIVSDDEGCSRPVSFRVYYNTEWIVWAYKEELELSKADAGVELKVMTDTSECIGYDPGLTYQWYYRNDDEDDWTEIDGATGETYTATSSKEYCCKATDEDGFSNESWFYVNNGFSNLTEAVKTTAEEINVDETKTVNTEGAEGLFAFTPKVSGTYLYYSSSAAGKRSDPKGRVVDESGKELAWCDDANFEDTNHFQIMFKAEAGKTYYLQAINYRYSATFTVSLVDTGITEISFTPSKEPLIATRWCSDQEDGYYRNGDYSKGDKISFHYKDGTSKVYVCKELIDREGDTYLTFVNEKEAGDKLAGYVGLDMDYAFDRSIQPGSTKTITAKASYASLETNEFTKDVKFIIRHDGDFVKTEAKPATCNAAGNITYWTCSECGKMFSDDKGQNELTKDLLAVAATGKHTWDSGVVTKKPDCTEKGVKTFKCKVCNMTKTEEIDALGHDYKAIADTAKAATCTEAGKEADQKCSRCGDVKNGKEIATLPHKLVKTDRVEPTTKAEGTEAYWTCSECKKLFSDAEGKNEIEAPVKIDKLPDPAKQMGSDGTALGKGASAAAAEKAVTSMKSDKDPKGSAFAVLKLKSTKQAKNSVTLNWSKAKGVTKYVIYGNMCGKANKMKKLATVKTNKYVVKKIINKKGKKVNVVKGKYYKFIVVAINKQNNVVSTSKVIHVASAGTKTGNYKSITVNKKVIKNAKALKKGKTLKLGAKLVPVAKKKVAKHVGLRYQTTNKKIATVSAKGVVKGVRKGTCYVYAYAQNGVFKKIKVVVK